MIGPFVEAVRAVPDPCSFLLVAPSLFGVVAAKGRWSALAASLAAGIVGGWLVAANRFVLDGWWLRLSAFVVGVALVALVAQPARRRVPWIEGPRAGAVLAAGTTLLASMWWRPCVGEELGVILTEGQFGGTRLIGQFPAMAGYMLGLLVPVVAVVLAMRAFEPGPTALEWTGRAAVAAGVVVAGALLLGQHDDVVVTLTRWTLE